MNLIHNNFASIESMREQLTTQNKGQRDLEEKKSSLSFADVLQQTQEKTELHFSKHANERLASRNIDLSTEQMKRLEDGTNKAREKGIKESLVMVDDLAFIVNIKNNTVITAVNETENSVFTNIDGAVIS